MSWNLALLLVAIAVTYFAWRRARRQSELARARASALEPARWRYRLEPDHEGDGRGYVVTTEEGTRLPDDGLNWDVHGVTTVVVDGSNVQPDTLQDERFEAGSGIQLTAGGDAAAPVVSVWDDAGSIRLGQLAPDAAARVRELLESGALSDCVVLRESTSEGMRTAVHLLLVHRDAAVEG